jgi:transcriptional regulator with XRE-family HTH domain
MNIGSKIRLIRNLKNLTLKQMSALVGINKSKLNRIELGVQQPKTEDMNKISTGIGMSVHAIENIDEEKVQGYLQDNQSGVSIHSNSGTLPDFAQKHAEKVENIEKRLEISENRNKELEHVLVKLHNLIEHLSNKIS